MNTAVLLIRHIEHFSNFLWRASIFLYLTENCDNISLVFLLITLIFVNLPSILLERCVWAEIRYTATTGSVSFNWWFA
jgi:hypothetical protein